MAAEISKQKISRFSGQYEKPNKPNYQNQQSLSEIYIYAICGEIYM